MNVGEAVTLTEENAVLLVRALRQAPFIMADHIGPELVHVSRMGKVHHVRHVAAAGTHIYFQSHKFACLAQAFFIFCQFEKFHMDEPALYAEGFYRGPATLLQLRLHGRRNIEAQLRLVVHNVHDRRGDAHGFKQHVALGIHNGIVGTDQTGDIFFHHIGVFRLFIKETFHIAVVFQTPGSDCAYAVFRFHDDRVAHLFNEPGSRFNRCDRNLPGRGHFGLCIVRLHGGFAPVGFNFIHVRAGQDVEIRPQHGVVFQPVFVV